MKEELKNGNFSAPVTLSHPHKSLSTIPKSAVINYTVSLLKLPVTPQKLVDDSESA